MKTRKKILSLLAALILLLSSSIQVFAVESEKLANNRHRKKIGETRFINAGDEIVFKTIPVGQKEPVEEYYYELATDKTVITPKGETVRLNAMGIVGQAPMVYFAFNQDSDRNIYFYGDIVAMDPTDPSTIMMSEWVQVPETGYCLNYPGQYYVGKEWNYTFTMINNFGQETSVDLVNKVVAYEKITIGAGKFWAFKINAYDSMGNLDSESWFSPKLGINIRRYSYSDVKPGYEFVRSSFYTGE